MKSPQQAKGQHHRHGDDQLPTHDNAHWLVSYPRHIFGVCQKQLLSVSTGVLKICSEEDLIFVPSRRPLRVLLLGHAETVKSGVN